jgi:ATP-dependent DNA helicase RecG
MGYFCQRLIYRMSENQNIEYKLSWHDEYLKWICGFANAQGGTLFIGIDDNGGYHHLENAAKLMEDIPNKIRNYLGIIAEVVLNETKQCQFISIHVNSSSVAVSLRGRYYYRSGSTKLELTGVELNSFLLKKTGVTWDALIQENATLGDIDEDCLAQFLRDSEEKGRMPDTKGLTPFQILEKLGLTVGPKLTKAAIILFGRNPHKFIPNTELKIGRFGTDSTDLKFQETVEGNVIHILKEAQIQLNHKFLVRPIQFVGMHRIEKHEYPVEALREMLLNALVHKNYLGAHIQLRVYDDRLSLWNEGVLPRGLEAEQLKREHSSRPRNPLIAKACFLAGYIDIWGRGTLKIYNSCKEAGLPEPHIAETEGGVKVVLYKHLETQYYATGKGPLKLSDPASHAATNGLVDGLVQGLVDGLVESQQKLLKLVVDNPQISKRRMAEIIGISTTAIDKNIEQLKRKKLLERVGSPKAGIWKVRKPKK